MAVRADLEEILRGEGCDPVPPAEERGECVGQMRRGWHRRGRPDRVLLCRTAKKGTFSEATAAVAHQKGSAFYLTECVLGDVVRLEQRRRTARLIVSAPPSLEQPELLADQDGTVLVRLLPPLPRRIRRLSLPLQHTLAALCFEVWGDRVDNVG